MSINEWAVTRGYAFITRKSTREKSGKQTVTYACDRSWLQPISEERQRKTTTRGTGCQFSVLAKESLDKSTWRLQHRSEARFSSHNHAPSWDPAAHPSHRQLSKEDNAKISSLSNAGIAPRDIRTFLRQNSSSLVTQQDIYNKLAATRRELYEGQSSISALISQLNQEGFWSQVQCDLDNRITAILFAHPSSLSYLQVCICNNPPDADAQTDPVHEQTDPLDAQANPLDAQANPLDAQANPLDAQADPLDARADPLDAQADPLDARADPLDV
jgi:hypothetical protein